MNEQDNEKEQHDKELLKKVCKPGIRLSDAAGEAMVVGISMVGTFVGMVVMAATVPASNGDPHLVSPEWQVDLRTVFAVGSVVVGGVWWLSKCIQRFEDNLTNGSLRFKRIEDRLQRMELRLEDLPCKSTDGCMGRKPKE